MFEYFKYRDMTLNGCGFAHIVHFYIHKNKIRMSRLVSFQRFPRINSLIGPVKP